MKNQEEETLYDYAQNVYTSLVHPIRFMGIGEAAASVIFCGTTLLAMMVSKYCIALGVIAFLIVKHLSKNEPYMIDFILDNLNQSEIYRG